MFIFDPKNGRKWPDFLVKINKSSTVATLTILHNKEEQPMDELELSPNIKKFTDLHFNMVDNVQYNFLGFMEDGDLIINDHQSKIGTK